MTVQRNLNQGAFGGNYATWYLQDLLVDSCGWTVAMSGSGNGGLYSSTTTVFGSANNPVIGADAVSSDHWGHGDCWMVLEDPNNRQILLKRSEFDGSARDDEWAMNYSETGVYTGGDATTAPTAADGAWLYGAGSTTAIFAPGTSTTILHILAQDAESAAGEYGFVLVEMEATNSVSAVLVMDPMTETATGDTHPVVLYAAAGSNSLSQYGLYGGTTYHPKTWLDHGGGSEQFTQVDYCWISRGVIGGSNTLFPHSAGASLYDGFERGVPAIIAGIAVGGYLGISYWFSWAGVDRGYPNTNGDLTKIYIDDILLNQWDGSTVPNTI